MFGADEDSELGENATLREADLLKQHSASSEDIEALVVDEDMPELDRFALLFERGRVVQRLSVMNSLPGLVADHGATACSALLGLLADQAGAMVRASTSALEDGRVDEHDLAVSAAQSITAVIEAPHHLPPSVVDRQLLPTALAALEEAPLTPIDEGAASAEWLHCLLCLLRSRRLAVATLTSQVLPWALSRGEVSSPVGHRLLCTYVIGALAEANPDSGWVEARFLSQVAHHQASQEAFIARLELRPSPIPSGPLAPMPGWWHTRSHTSNTLDRCRAVLTKCSCPPPPLCGAGTGHVPGHGARCEVLDV